MEHGGAEAVGAQAINEGPEHAAGRVGDEEAAPFHAVHAGKNGGQYPEHGDEPAEEHHLAAVMEEKVLAQLDPRFRQADVAPVAQQKAVSELPPYPIADIVSEDRPDGGRGNDGCNMEIRMRAGVDRA